MPSWDPKQYLQQMRQQAMSRANSWRNRIPTLPAKAAPMTPSTGARPVNDRGPAPVELGPHYGITDPSFVDNPSPGKLTSSNYAGFGTQPAPMKKGGKVASASKRADGIAQRGKTRGKMR